MSVKSLEDGLLGGCVSSNSCSFVSASISRMILIRPPQNSHSLHLLLKQRDASLIKVADAVVTRHTQNTSLNVAIYITLY